MPRLRFLVIPLLTLFAALFGVAQMAEQPGTQPDLPAQYNSVVVGQSASGSAPSKSYGLTVYVDALTSDGELHELNEALKSKGSDGLLSALGATKDKGRVAPTGAVGTGMRLVSILPTKDGGQHIVLATDRPISFPELYNAPRTRDYPFAVVVLDIGKDGKGEGSFAPACKIKFNKNEELEIEHYGQKPFRLANVYRQK